MVMTTMKKMMLVIYLAVSYSYPFVSVFSLSKKKFFILSFYLVQFSLTVRIQLRFYLLQEHFLYITQAELSSTFLSLHIFKGKYWNGAGRCGAPGQGSLSVFPFHFCREQTSASMTCPESQRVFWTVANQGWEGMQRQGGHHLRSD